jgi:hypothetical protein
MTIDTSRMLDEYIVRTGGNPMTGTTMWQYETGILRETLARVQAVLERWSVHPPVIRDVIEDLIYGSPSSVSHWMAEELLRQQLEQKPAEMLLTPELEEKLRRDFRLQPRE